MEQLSLLDAPEAPPSKQCRKCGETKPLDAFGRKKGNADGLQARCKDCINDDAKAYRDSNPGAAASASKRWRTANPEKQTASTRTWIEANRDHVRARDRAAYAANPERKLSINARWNTGNPERRRVHRKSWEGRNPDKVQARHDRRRASKERALFEDVSRLEVWIRDGGMCHLCGGAADPEGWHLEHIIALANGGAHSYQNCAVSHQDCNQVKGDRRVPSALGLLGSYAVTPVCCL